HPRYLPSFPTRRSSDLAIHKIRLAAMLITFKSKATAEVTMVEEHAKRILNLLHKDAKRGVITAAEAGTALSKLEAEVAESRAHRSEEHTSELQSRGHLV